MVSWCQGRDIISERRGGRKLLISWWLRSRMGCKEPEKGPGTNYSTVSPKATPLEPTFSSEVPPPQPLSDELITNPWESVPSPSSQITSCLIPVKLAITINWHKACYGLDLKCSPKTESRGWASRSWLDLEGSNFIRELVYDMIIIWQQHREVMQAEELAQLRGMSHGTVAWGLYLVSGPFSAPPTLYLLGWKKN